MKLDAFHTIMVWGGIKYQMQPPDSYIKIFQALICLE